ncbi:hypothetical protein AUR64_04995 [Haloprofundus marisrubri]|uniref:Uncharacterized protein n=1 Tax=Haloprofundus marisrubri TaxID=1514971 RepID=A0A0W1RCY8_9EURY|nr:hypothetical protein AUR64_04995 [Haloprofundus marisrubri]
MGDRETVRSSIDAVRSSNKTRYLLAVAFILQGTRTFLRVETSVGYLIATVTLLIGILAVRHTVQTSRA